jgi:hypothetical protein
MRGNTYGLVYVQQHLICHSVRRFENIVMTMGRPLSIRNPLILRYMRLLSHALETCVPLGQKRFVLALEN